MTENRPNIDLDGGDFLKQLGDDASKWAAAFCDIAKRKGLEIDEEWMIGWFANAIEHSGDVRRQQAREIDALTEQRVAAAVQEEREYCARVADNAAGAGTTTLSSSNACSTKRPQSETPRLRRYEKSPSWTATRSLRRTRAMSSTVNSPPTPQQPSLLKYKSSFVISVLFNEPKSSQPVLQRIAWLD